jgi:DNA-binding XRE family transcriptional regulator
MPNGCGLETVESLACPAMKTEKSLSPENRARLRAFGRRIKLMRIAEDWSQEQLAEATGLHRTFIGQVERGQRGMNIIQLWLFAKAFNVEIGELFTDEKGRPIP